MSLTIRRATNADQDAVVHVIKAVYDEYGFPWIPDGYHADLYDLEGSYDAMGDEFFLAELDGIPVGTAALEVFPVVPAGVVTPLVRIEGCDCSIERLYVHPSARRKRVGQSLMQHVMDRARELGRTQMEIWSDVTFLEAHTLYEKFGASVVANRLCDDPDESPEYGLSLRL